MVELTASGDADQVKVRLREALDEHDLQLFARIDHATGARKADVELEANVLLIYGNTSVGTPLMQADPHVGIELPLRMLIWQDPDGTHVGYLEPRGLAIRDALDGHEQTLERQAAVLAKLAAAAASCSNPREKTLFLRSTPTARRLRGLDHGRRIRGPRTRSAATPCNPGGLQGIRFYRQRDRLATVVAVLVVLWLPSF